MRTVFGHFLLLAVRLAIIGILGCQKTETKTVVEPKGDIGMAFKITSTAFENGSSIPAKYTRDGKDVSPPLSWTNPPEGTKALVLICDDPDAPAGTWIHWVLYDIPADIREIEEDIPDDEMVLGTAKHGMTDFHRLGYGGPAPPPGNPHRYFFKLYAVDAETGLKPGATKSQVLKTIEGHMLGQAELMGMYQR